MEKVFDIHIHYTFEIPLAKTIEIFKKEFTETGTEKGVFLSLPHDVKNNVLHFDCTQNLKSLFLKRAFAPNYYAFAGLEHPQNHDDTKAVSKEFLRQAKEYFSVGFDGVKMLEGYPSLIKAWNLPVDSPVYDEFYAFMEENGYPILMHIANPTENWDLSKASKYAIAQGRVYDETYPTKGEITAQTFRVLEKFPKLKLILAHCGFFSDEIGNAERFLGKYENTVLDITPGGEQLIRMSKEWGKWLPFWEKYQDRIVYGTDFYAFPDEDEEEWKTCFWRRPRLVRQLLETDSTFQYLDEEFTGVKLEQKLRNKIYRENGERILKEPKPIVDQYLVEQAKKLLGVENKAFKYADEDLRYILRSIL